jgi:hypothetical protein
MNEIEQVQTEALTIRDQAKAIVIVDKESYERAGTLMVAVKKLRKQIKEVFKPMKDKAQAAHKEIVAQEKKADAEAAATEAILLPAMTAYDEKYGASKIEGLRKPQDIWKFNITDLAKIPREFMEPDTVKIGEYVRTMRESTKIEGIEVYCERGGIRVEGPKQIEF